MSCTERYVARTLAKNEGGRKKGGEKEHGDTYTRAYSNARVCFVAAAESLAMGESDSPCARVDLRSGLRSYSCARVCRVVLCVVVPRPFRFFISFSRSKDVSCVCISANTRVYLSIYVGAGSA